MRLLPMTLLALTAFSCAQPADDASPASPTSPPTRVDRDFYLGGIQIHEEALDDWFQNLERHGMNTVHITDYATQGDWDSDDLRFDTGKSWLLEEIRGAKARGLSVVLVLRIHLDTEFERNAFLWHGMILPKTDALLESWFRRYTQYCLEWARIAEAEGVDALFFGSELNALASTLPAEGLPQLEEYFLNDQRQAERRLEVERQRRMLEGAAGAGRSFDDVGQDLDARIANEEAWARTVVGDRADAEVLNRRRAQLQGHWVQLITDLRGTYSGPLGYAANFDQFKDVGFWSQVDLMGINAYFPLRRTLFEDFDAEALYPHLRQGWLAALDSLASYRSDQGLETPVIFTELGYTWRRQSTLEPWAHTGFSVIPKEWADGRVENEAVVWGEQPKQLEERALAVRALREAQLELDASFLRGILYWKLSSHDYHEGDEPYTVHIGPESQDPVLPQLRRFVDLADPASGASEHGAGTNGLATH